MRKRKYKHMLWGIAFILPSLAGVMIFVLIPFADAVRRSFFEAMGDKFVGFENYISIFQNDSLKLAAKNTLRFTVICIPLLLVSSLLMAVLLNQLKLRLKGAAEVLKTIFLIPMAIPVTAVALLWKVFFYDAGLLNQVVLWFGGTSSDYMNTGKAFYVLIFSYLWKNIGYTMVLWLAGLTDISMEIYEAAMVDGAGERQKFFYITLPGIAPTIFIAAILSLINSFKVFREAYLIAGGYPHESIYMLQHIFNNWFIQLDIQKLCATAVLLAIIITIFILIVQKLGKQGVDDYE